MLSKRPDFALARANRPSTLHRVPGGELRSVDVALTLARCNQPVAAITAQLLASLLTGRKVKHE